MPALINGYLEWSYRARAKIKSKDPCSDPEPTSRTANSPPNTPTAANEPNNQDADQELRANPTADFDPELDYNHPVDLEENETLAGVARGSEERVWEVVLVGIFGA